MEPNEGSDYLLWWLVPALICVAFVLAWSNHFGNGFHWEDSLRILDNKAVQSRPGLVGFFTRPRTSSALPEQTEYHPLLMAEFAAEYAVRGADPFVFQLDTFLWLVLLLLALCALFRLLIGGRYLCAVLAAGLFAVHPVIADTVNYISRRGAILGALGIAAGLALRIVWPDRMPPRLWVDTRRTAVNWREELLEARAARYNGLYQRFIHLPLGLYLIPVALAMLVEPSAALFAPLLAIYLWLFEPERGFRRVVPAAILCGGYFVFATILTWRFDAASRIPFFNWILTEPWVAAKYLFHFFVIAGLSPDSGLRPFTLAEWPFTLCGLAVLALVWALALYTSRRHEWKSVSFGLWWFLIALLPAAVIPGRMVEANSRMFLPFIGLALASTRTVWILIAGLSRRPGLRMPVTAAAFLLFVVVFSAAAWTTYQRNQIWSSEETFWQTAARMSPDNGRAVTHEAQTDYAAASYSVALEELHRAEPLVAGNANLETDLALAFDLMNDAAATQKHFERAVSASPNYARAWSAWSSWLLTRQKGDEALRLARKAIALEPTDATAAHTMLDVYSQRFDWQGMKQVARSVLATYPEDEIAQHSAILAQSTLEGIANTAAAAKSESSPGDYLKLSALYFQNRQFKKSIAAARSALKLDNQMAGAWANLSAAQHELGDDDGAIASLREVLRLRPDMTFAARNLDYLLAKKAERAQK